MATVTECLAHGANSVSLINDINTNGSSSGYAALCANQAEINELVQRNVDHLSTILLYEPVDGDDTPNVKGAADSKKTTHVAAITTGTDYIAAN